MQQMLTLHISSESVSPQGAESDSDCAHSHVETKGSQIQSQIGSRRRSQSKEEATTVGKPLLTFALGDNKPRSLLASVGARHLHGNPHSFPLESRPYSESPDHAGVDMDSIDMFFRFVHPLVPVVHRETFYRQLRPVNQHPPALLYAMYATISPKSNLISTHAAGALSGEGDPGDKYFEASRAMLQDSLHEPQLASVQALVLLTCYAGGVGQTSLSQVLLTIAIRMAQQLRLNHDTELQQHTGGQPRDWYEHETGRRLWWLLYLMVSFAKA
jgi:hypothetical protein